MKASYQLKLEQHQRRLGLTHKELNKLDRKHNDVNLLRHLQSLDPKVSAPSEPVEYTGFYGTFVVYNEKEGDSQPRHMHVYLAYDDIPLTESVQINGNHDHMFNVHEDNRLPLPNSLLQLKITMQNGTQSVDLSDPIGFEPISFTENPLDEENTFDMLVDSNFLDEGECSVIFVVTYQP